MPRNPKRLSNHFYLLDLGVGEDEDTLGERRNRWKRAAEIAGYRYLSDWIRDVLDERAEEIHKKELPVSKPWTEEELEKASRSATGLDKWRLEGQLAAMRDTHISDCPYPPSDEYNSLSARNCWMIGYESIKGGGVGLWDK